MYYIVRYTELKSAADMPNSQTHSTKNPKNAHTPSETQSNYVDNSLLFPIQTEVDTQTLEIHEVNTVEQFSKLRNTWNEVLRRSMDDSPFLTWEHIAVSVSDLKKNQKLRILYITCSGKIIAIAPLRQSFHHAGGIKYSVVEPLDYDTATDYNGIILAENEIACLSLFLSYFYRHKDWDFLCINDVPETSSIANILIKNSNLFPKFKIDKGAACPYFKFPDSMDNFLKGLGRNYRKNFARRLRNLSKDHGNVELREYDEIFTLEQGMQIFFDLHQKRWVSLGQKGAFHSTEIRRIFLERAEFFAEKGWFGLYFLTADGKPIAAKYCLKYNNKIYGCLSGFDPSFSQYSVGKTLLMKVVERGIQQGFNEYDFMKGEEVYKFKLADGFRRNLKITFTNSKFSSQLLAIAISAEKTRKIGLLMGKLGRLYRKARVA